MNKQATIKDKKDWTSISYDDFIEFTEGFEVFALAEAAEEIMNVYLGQAAGDSKPKKEEGQLTE